MANFPLYKARDKVSKDLVALKMVKMEPGEKGRPQNAFPRPTLILPGMWATLLEAPASGHLFSPVLPDR